MNNSEILAKVFQLKDMIVENELYKDLKIKEKEMMDNDECFNLLCLYQNVQSKYNEAKRFENFGVNIACLNRFRKPAQQKRILQELKQGKIPSIC